MNPTHMPDPDRLRIAAGKKQKEKSYWLEKLSGEPVKSSFPCTFVHDNPSDDQGSVSLHMEGALYSGLMKLSNGSDIRLHIVLTAVITLLLSKYTGNDDIIIGTLVSHGAHGGHGERSNENEVTELINTILALRNQLNDHISFKELLLQVRQTVIEAEENRNYPFEILINQLNLPEVKGTCPLFDVGVILENIQDASYFSRITPKVVFAFKKCEGYIECNVVYDIDCYHREAIEQIAGHLKHLIEIIISDVEIKLSEIDFLFSEERDQLLYHFNRINEVYLKDKTIHGLFSNQAVKTPDHLALIGSISVGALREAPPQISYRELDHQSDELASELTRKGVGPDVIVGIKIERSIEMIIGILSILKAGGAYLPIDPGLPQDRVDYMLKDSQARLLVTNLVGADLHVCPAGAHIGAPLQRDFCVGADPRVCPSPSFLPTTDNRQPATSLAYVIYTSGSTGKPKGVLIRHSNICPLLHWGYENLNLNSNDRSVQNLSYYFDWSVWEIFITLTSGAGLHMVSGELIMDGARYADFMNRYGITVLHITPTHFQALIHSGKRLPTLRHLCIGAEKLTHDLVEKSIDVVNDRCRIYNMYGPTEATIMAAVLNVEPSDLPVYRQLSGVPIGGNRGNNVLFILDKNDHLCPINVFGELHIGGDGVSPGYLNNPELTAEKFSSVPSVCPVRKKIYKTGDLCRWLEDGTIEFLRRIDEQVKVRGFRIELGEIEARLFTHHEIKEAVVTVKENKAGDKYLAAYVTSDRTPSESELREHLLKTLPEYMVPSYFIQIQRIPLTPNGKLNRKALPEPTISAVRKYATPENEIEKTLVHIWSQILAQPSDQIGIDDSFFELGGHSLKATIMGSEIQKELNVRIPLSEIFEHPTIRELAEWIRGATQEEYESIQPIEEKEHDELSYAQRRLWVLCQFEEDSTAYNMPAAVVLTGSLNTEALRLAIEALATRHESLRTLFVMVNGEPHQRIIDSRIFKRDYHFFKTVDLHHPDEEERDSKTKHIYQEMAGKAFNLEKGPLFEFISIRLEEEKYVLAFNIHHIISDGWSQGVIYSELISFYNTYCEGNDMPLSPLQFQYKDYSHWHNRLIAKGHFDTIGKYWLDKFNDKPNGIELPLDHLRQPIQTFNGGRVSFIIDNEKVSQLQQLCADSDATFFMGLLTFLDIFLYKYTGQRDILLGAPIANRKQAEFHQLMGFLVNTLVYRTMIDPCLSFKKILTEVKTEALNCYEYQDFPFDLLIEQLGLERDLSQSPLFNVMIAHNNTETENRSSLMEGLTISDYTHIEEFNMSKFDLTFFMDEVENRMKVRIEYNSDLFERPTIERMAENFRVLLDGILEKQGADIPVSALNMLSNAQYETVTHTFNDTRYDFPSSTLMQLFENRVQTLKEKIAVVHHEATITYDDLNKRANKIAHYLRNNYQVQPNDIIGISMDRSIAMIAVILGVLKSGAAYLAVDPTYPRDRVWHVLSDSHSKLLIIDQMRPELFDSYTGEILHILKEWEKVENESDENPVNLNQPSDVLYVNYTSGSTGTPNGAMLSHDCLTNLIYWQNEKTTIDCSLRCLQFTSINFCVSFQEIMGTLTAGGELHLIGDIERQDTDYLMTFLVEHKIDILFLPFSYLNFLFNEFGRWEKSFNHHLKHIITAGEQLKITVGLKRFLNLNPGLKLHNHYGSTEMHVVTSYTLDASSAEKTPIPPAGKPVSNIRIFILDESLNPVPVGVYGELCVEGSREILGYINNKELTDRKLIHCPDLSQTRLYRSGDIGRWLPDGNIELRGRKDFLVKVRGFRVEPGEIESKILSIPNVRECVVVVREDEQHQKYLVAYVSLSGDERGLDGFEMKRILGTQLPHYMIPQIILMESLPLMPNGKVDREKLPDPQFSDMGEHEVLRPTDEVEKKLAAIWSELVGLDEEKIGIDDNFFELGGHSLKATTMVSKIHQAFDVKVELIEIFRSPTIRDIAHGIRGLTSDRFVQIEPVEKKEYYGLSSTQKRLYVLQQIMGESTGYNMPVVMELEGVLDKEKLETVFGQLIKRHESLRTSFHLIDGEAVQRVHDEVEFKIRFLATEDTEVTEGEREKLRSEEVEKIREIDRFVKFFDLRKAPLMRVGLLRIEEFKHLLIVDMHHIISDGTSMNILVKDFMALYEGRNLPSLHVHYKDFSEWQNSERKGGTLKRQEEFWLNEFGGEIPVLELPVDYARPAVQRFEGDHILFEIDQEITSALKHLMLETGATLFMVLLAAYAVFLSKLSGQKDIVIGTSTAGRGHADLETIIGMFINTVALRTYPSGEKPFIEFLYEVKERTLQTFENQDYQYEELTDNVVIKRDPGRNPLFDVLFMLQNFKLQELTIPGLKLSPHEYHSRTSKFDLTLSAIETHDRLTFAFEYSTGLFKRETIERFILYFKTIITGIIENKDRRILDFETITQEDKNRILDDFNCDFDD
ncbi:MAG: amino acid adenylation domain-containing protein [Candidatus Omnitrophota bacterium]